MIVHQSLIEGLNGRYYAGESIVALRVLYLNTADNLIYYADKDLLGCKDRIIGISTISAAIGEEVGFLEMGLMIDASWSWDTSKLLLLGSSGSLSQIPPTTGFILQLGRILATNSIFIDIGIPITLAA